uniref:Putative hhh secreted protein n=1 Tax=Psorophora albipes TaxID=869069 RepID=T1E399_9DIPT
MKLLLVIFVATIAAILALAVAFPDHRDDEGTSTPPSGQWNGTADNIAELLFNLTFPDGEIPFDFDQVNFGNNSGPIQPRPFRASTNTTTTTNRATNTDRFLTFLKILREIFSWVQLFG